MFFLLTMFQNDVFLWFLVLCTVISSNIYQHFHARSLARSLASHTFKIISKYEVNASAASNRSISYLDHRIVKWWCKACVYMCMCGMMACFWLQTTQNNNHNQIMCERKQYCCAMRSESCIQYAHSHSHE